MTELRRHWGTAVKLTAYLALILTATLTLSLLALLHAFSTQSDATTVRSLVAEIRAFTAAAAPAGTTALPATSESYLRTKVLPDGEQLLIQLPDGTLLGSAGSGPIIRSTALTRWLAAPGRPQQTRLHVAGQTYLSVAVPFADASGRPTGGAVIATSDLAQNSRDFNRVRALAIGEAVVAIAAGCLGAYLLLRRLLRRVGRITATAADLGSGALDRRLRETEDGDEVGQLASTFDAMADQLSTVMQTQRRMLSDVSHQLRTPLTVAQGHLEVLARAQPSDPADTRETIALVLDEIGHMKAMVERLLMLGRAMEPDFLEIQPIDLRSFCVDLVDAAQVLAIRRWVLEPVPDVVIDADASKLRGALLNLVDNAVRATQDLDVIRLSVQVEDGGAVVFTVEDSGPGIPPARRTAVLQRFARPGAADSDGSGLGLAIVVAVAQAHGGTVAIDASPLGGARVAMRLPVRSSTAPSLVRLDDDDRAGSAVQL